MKLIINVIINIIITIALIENFTIPSIIFLAMSMVTRSIFFCFIAPLERFSFRYMTYRSKTLTFSFFSVPSLYIASQL